MAVYVDGARNGYGRMVMCHMVADTLDELHEMAAEIGLKREWFQPLSFPHYDVSLTRRAEAVKRGAIEVGRHGIVAVKRRFRQNKAEWEKLKAEVQRRDRKPDTGLPGGQTDMGAG